MLVKKVKPDWAPSENRDLKVGETIEITDPKELILSGAVVAFENGVEKSAFELYGVITDDEKRKYQEYLAFKNQSALKSKLEKEKEELESQVKEETKEETAVVEPAKLEVPSAEELHARRVANLEKARAARAVKLAEKK